MIQRAIFCRMLVLAAVSSPALAANQAHVVDWANGPGADFLEIQDAVNAASDGDTVLVRVGIYGSVIVDGKGVSILADTGSEGLRPIVSWFRIQNLPAGSYALLRGLQSSVLPNPFGVSSNLVVSSNAGHVFVENMALEGGAPVVSVTASSQTLFTRSTFTASGIAIDAAQSAVHVHECVLTGGAGNDGAVTPFGTIPAGEGNPAMQLSGGAAVLGGATLEGGAGGNGDSSCNPPGDGGPALRVTGVGPTVVDVASAFTGGPGGSTSPSCPSGMGATGPPTDVQAGSFTTASEPHRSLAFASPAREGNTLAFQIKGVAGEPTLLLYSFQEDLQPFAALTGTLVPGSPLFALPFVAIPPGGTLAFATTLPVNLLPAGVDALDVFVQVAVPGALGQGVVGSSSLLTIVDGAV